MKSENQSLIGSRLDQLAAGFGTDGPTAVALMGLVLRGVTTRQDETEELAGRTPLPDFHVGLVDDPGCGSSLIARLLCAPRKIERLLVEKFAQTDPKMLKEAWDRGGADPNRPGLPVLGHGDQVARQKEMAFGVSHRGFGPEAEVFGRSELKEGKGYDRLDLALRPRFMMEGANPGQLRKELSRCHRSSGLFHGSKVEALGSKEVAEILEVMGGTRVPLPEQLQGGSPGATEHSDATFLLQGLTEAWSEPVAAPLRGKMLLLPPAEEKISGDIDFEGFRKMVKGWDRAILWFLDHRRWGIGTFVTLGDSVETHTAFAGRRQEYLRTCREAGVENPSVRELPRLIAWVLTSLFDRADRDVVVDQAFRYAEILRDRHLRVESQLAGEVETRRVLDLARQLRDKIARKQPVGFRDLVRSFDIQRSSRYRPVLESMIQAGLVIEHDPGVYRTGPVAEVETAMRRVLAHGHFKSVA